MRRRDLLLHRLKLAIILCFSLMAASFCFYGTATVVNGVGGEAPLVSPTGLTASDNDYASKVGLHWQPVRSATAYRIFRNTSSDSGSAVDVGTTAANYFFDATAAAGQQYFYWVRAENAQTSSNLSNFDQGTRAIGDGAPGPPFPPLQPPVTPGGNPVTAAKAYLGKTLFWDEQLSSTKTVSCGTCHRPAEGGSDPRTSAATRHPGFDGTMATPDDIFGSPGVPLNYADGNYGWSTEFGMGLQVTGRKAPSYLNAGYSDLGLFWDGRAADVFRDPITNAIILGISGSLESQAVGPPLSASEMGHTGRDWPQVVARVSASRPLALAQNIPSGLTSWIDDRTYPELFEEAFGSPEITPARIAMAIGTHERTLFSDRTPLDRYSANIGVDTLTVQEEDGRDLFLALQCTFCHGGALLTDQAFHNVGVRPQVEDRGRGAINGIPADDAKFKTPNLRNLELRGPYMHNGRFATLEDVVEFYNRGGDFDAPNIDRVRIRPRNMTAQQKADLVAFLKRPLTDERVKLELPPFDRPQLYTESNRVPVVSGVGREGSGGITPNPIAIEPPIVGNPSFTVAVSGALGAASAVVVISSTDPGVGATIPSSGSFARINVQLSGSGTGNGYGSANLAISNNPALVGQTFYGRWYVSDPAAANGFSVSRLFQFTIFGDAVAADDAPFDFDGDGKTDLSIFRPSVGEWWINRSSNGTTFAAQFGATTDRITPGDFTGDGKADIAIWRPSSGEWFVLRSEDSSFFSFPFGTNGDTPMPADYDNDGKVDAAVFRASNATWYVRRSSDTGTTIEGFGADGDVPVTADYDGDGKSDIAIYRPSLGQWWIKRSTLGVIAFTFGTSTDKPVQGDYSGDGKADVAFWRPSTGEWYILRSEDFSYYSQPFGTTSDITSPGDYDGDGKFDPTVFRPSSATWFSARSTAGTLIQQFGSTGDQPVPNSFVP